MLDRATPLFPLPAITEASTRCSIAHHVRPTIASQSGTITFQFFHQAMTAPECTPGPGSEKMGIVRE